MPASAAPNACKRAVTSRFPATLVAFGSSVQQEPHEPGGFPLPRKAPLRKLAAALRAPLRHRLPHALRAAVPAGALLALLAAPFALGSGEGGPIRGGQRNPGFSTSQQYRTETQIIADNGGFGTRQSNKGSGGGAIYGCRSLATANACVAAVNLNTGHAFSFTSGGNVGGTITLRNKAGAPLTTNATGVATGFNANYLQGKQASDFVPATQAASFAQTSQLLFAVVDQTGKLGNTRGATAAAQTGEKAYTVTFNANVSKCSFTASPVGQALTTGSIGLVSDTSNPNVVDVSAPSALAAGFSVQVVC